MEIKINTRYANTQYYSCNYALVLDKRHKKEGKDTYPLAMRFTIDRKHFYYNVEGEYTEEQFSLICSLSKKAVRSDLYEKKEIFDSIFEKYKAMVEHIGPGITLDKIRIACSRIDSNNEITFMSIWEDIVDHYYKDNGGEHYTTGEKYDDALKCFKRRMGENRIVGFKISAEDIQEWKDRMSSGIAYDGSTHRQLADATIGMHLRTLRVIWNECVNRGYLVDVPYPFSDKDIKGKVSIPKGKTRKHQYLTVEQMTELYNVFIEKRYPESWSDKYRNNAHWSLGLFLIQYLCNGFNLVDAALLRYNDFYFEKGRKAFLFSRKKTSGRSKEASEVIVPIIEPLQKILDEIAAKPENGARVFPEILMGCNDRDEKTIRKNSNQENSNVKDRVKKICEEVLEWEVFPSGTWCRHSFATNLAHAGVDRSYISESMGHSVKAVTTDLYIDRYPIEKQMVYNSLLLNLPKQEDPQVPKMPDFDNMTKEEMSQLLKEIWKKQNT